VHLLGAGAQGGGCGAGAAAAAARRRRRRRRRLEDLMQGQAEMSTKVLEMLGVEMQVL
jgi:hypothetical protein